MSLITLKNLRVFRGTYAEIQEKETEDKTIYLAWDTQEIFIGNARGVKVKYGGIKNLNSTLDEKFNTFKNELNELISNLASQAVGENVDNAVSEFATRFGNELSTLTTTVQNINSTLSTQMTALQNSTTQEINTFKTTTNEAIEGLRNTVNANNTQVQALATQISGISSNTSRIGALETSVQTVQNTVSALSTSAQKHIGYMTGEELEYFISHSGAANLIPTLCITDSTNYSAGTIYYWNGTELAEASGGSGSGNSGTTLITGYLSANFANNSPVVINATPLVKTINVNMSNVAAIDTSSISLSCDGEAIEYIDGTTTYTASVDISQPRVISLSISGSANPKPNRKTDYSVETSGDSFEVYVPLLLPDPNTGNLVQSNYTYGDYEFNYAFDSNGETISIYSYTPIVGIKFGDFEGQGFDSPNEVAYFAAAGQENKSVNGVDIRFYKYNIGPLYGETPMLIRQ